MSRVWFSQPLETVATFWRVMRRDGVTLGFTSHDRDLWFEGVLHRAAPGMVPSAIRRSADFEPDSAEVEGALSHAAISADDLANGRYDGAAVMIGVVDWESLERHAIYRGTIGTVAEEAGGFTAALVSRKAELARDPVPRTSPSCRAAFCGPGCTLSAARFTHEARLTAWDSAANAAVLDCPASPAQLAGGTLRWLDGPLAGFVLGIAGTTSGGGIVLDLPLDEPPAPGSRVIAREGCDRTLETCASRFANTVNFQGEPHLPGNDLVTRYPSPAG
ncbi:MAG: hypothetical protein RL702_688 [Pseudomonadota bacterium]|nr:MAG: DUF2163 domain-containing protein [Gammaproteobacteria bacterium]HMT47334.1 DUF2163 domain-containing protein [Novosphingobium sp.]HOA47871.1 DUF2163 domain-containing protein [Novosphingobium sp.]HPZ45588.1 DUF2163 domain-containing protein [Novosphingobium sp.]HQE00377.1 DUF2163 domain-containing protein [Novosphingobium sp.]